MDAEEIIARLEAPTEDRRPLMRELYDHAPTTALAEALERGPTPLTRRLLADLLGDRAEPATVHALVARLDDDDAGVRAAAADALGKLFMAGTPPAPGAARAAGDALLARWEAEPEPPVRHMLASALGAVGHRPAVPVLQAALSSGDVALERSAAWALEHMGVGA